MFVVKPQIKIPAPKPPTLNEVVSDFPQFPHENAGILTNYAATTSSYIPSSWFTTLQFELYSMNYSQRH
jgi:hypothetical protein